MAVVAMLLLAVVVISSWMKVQEDARVRQANTCPAKSTFISGPIRTTSTSAPASSQALSNMEDLASRLDELGQLSASQHLPYYSSGLSSDPAREPWNLDGGWRVEDDVATADYNYLVVEGKGWPVSTPVLAERRGVIRIVRFDSVDARRSAEREQLDRLGDSGVCFADCGTVMVEFQSLQDYRRIEDRDELFRRAQRGQWALHQIYGDCSETEVVNVLSGS